MKEQTPRIVGAKIEDPVHRGGSDVRAGAHHYCNEGRRNNVATKAEGLIDFPAET